MIMKRIKINLLNIINYYFNLNLILLIILLSIILNYYQLIVISKECGTIDVRNHPSSLEQLRKCTVIKGYLQIVLIQQSEKIIYSDKDYKNYSFPELREVTEFVIFFDVAGLTSLGLLFPSLTVIRGRRLFLNYALSIDSMPDLKSLDLPSLVSIQRGSVYINRNPNLCYLENINWDALTENKIGRNLYKSMKPNDCLGLRGCTSNYYWSNIYCQKFRIDNVISPINTSNCHSQCLGGCRGISDTDCAVCKGITDDTHCVEQCPTDKYFAEDHLRCYTKLKCTQMGRYLFNKTCIKECPPGYSDLKSNLSDYECYECKNCSKICTAYDEIQYLSDAEHLKGCTIIKGNLSIRIVSKIDTTYLENVLGDIVEIHDYLKIYRTTSITSLNFLKNLKVIHGNSLEFNRYSLIIYENKNLKNLWNWNNNNYLKQNITITDGGIFLYANYKLCSNEINKLNNYVKHNKSMDLIQINDEEILCDPIQLEANVTVKSHETVILMWSKDESADRTQILYRKLQNPNITLDDDYEDNVCFREIWTKDILLHDDLIKYPSNNNSNNKYWIYELNDLQQGTWYALVIKTYGVKMNKKYFSSQSDVIRFKTKPDIPMSPQIFTLSKTSNSITLTWKSITDEHQIIEYYLVDIFVQPDDQNILDTRDYCSDPLKQISSSVVNNKMNFNLDYDDCCSRIEDELEDREFVSLIDEKFRCSQNSNFANSCKIVKYHTKVRRSISSPSSLLSQDSLPDAYNSEYLLKSDVIDYTNTHFEIKNLTHYTLYIFQFFACNEIGCGAYELHSDRTAPLLIADNVSLSIKKGKNNNNEYLLYFPQPKSPNGATVAFTIEYRFMKNDGNYTGGIKCITRLKHEQNNYYYSIFIDHKNFWARVKSISLAGPGIPTNWIFYTIDQNENANNNNNNNINLENDTKQLDGFVIFCIILFCCVVIALIWIAYKKFILSRFVNNVSSNTDEQILMQEFDTNSLDDFTQEVEM